jgi:hypothetical protein
MIGEFVLWNVRACSSGRADRADQAGHSALGNHKPTFKISLTLLTPEQGQLHLEMICAA